MQFLRAFSPGLGLLICLSVSSARADFIQYFKFDGDATATVGTDGTAQNGASFTTGKLGGAADIENGTADNNQRVTAGVIGFANDPPSDTTFTSSHWFNIRGPSADTRSTNHLVDNAFWGQGSSGGGNDNLEIGINNSFDALELYLDSTSSDSPYSISIPGGPLSTNEWHHVAWTYDGNAASNQSQIYLNGELIGTIDSGVGMADNAGTGSQFLVGQSRHDSQWGDFDGLIDDLALYERTLTPGEAIALFNLGDNSALAYDAEDAEQLFDLFALGPGGGTLDITGASGEQTWQFTENAEFVALAPDAGNLAQFGRLEDGFFLNLDGMSGLFVEATVPLTPEPGTLALFGVVGVVFAGYQIHRRRNG